MSKLCTQMRLEGTSFHASLGSTGMEKRASFEIFVRQIRTTVRKWELCYMTRLCLQMHQIASHCIFISKNFRGACPQTPRKLVAFAHSGLLPQTKILGRTLNGRKNRRQGGENRENEKSGTSGRRLCLVYFIFKHNYYTNMAAMTCIIRVPQD